MRWRVIGLVLVAVIAFVVRTAVNELRVEDPECEPRIDLERGVLVELQREAERLDRQVDTTVTAIGAAQTARERAAAMARLAALRGRLEATRRVAELVYRPRLR